MSDVMFQISTIIRGKTRRYRLGRRFARDHRAVSAVEFALVLPVMITLYFGGVELSDGIIVDRKVTAMTSAIGDLVARGEVIEDAEMSNIFEAASSIMAPYSADPINLVVTHVTIDEDGNGIVDWSDRWSNGTMSDGYNPGSTLDIPDGLAAEDTTLVLAEGEYLYTPIFGQIVTSNITFRDTFYLRPRTTDAIQRP